MNLVDGEAVRLQPRGDGSQIRVGRTVKAAELARRKPLVKGGISRRVRGLDELPQRRLLLRGAGQQKQHPSGGQGIFDRSLIDAGLNHGVEIAVKRDTRSVIDRALNPRRDLRRGSRGGGIAGCGPGGRGGET